jgi:hypothetical protein
MKYNDAKSLIKTGDLLFWSERRWNSLHDIEVELIRLFTFSEYCHVGIAYAEHTGLSVIEAVPPVVRFSPLAVEAPFYWMPIGAPLSPHAIEFALSTVGQSYSWVRAFLAWLGCLPANRGSWECGELSNRILKESGIDLGKNYTPNRLAQAGLEYGFNISFVQQD